MLIAEINIRISELETQLRQMTGQLEEANFKVSSLSRQIETMEKDYEFRFVEIEGGVGGLTPKVSSRSISNNAPAATSTPKQKYDYAYGLVSNAQYDEAEISLLEFLQDYPENTLAGNAQYWLGQTLYARSNYDDATRTFIEGMVKYPKSTKAPAFILKVGMSLNKRGEKSDACDIYRELNARFPDSSENTRLRPVEERKAGCD
jgi:tol-pal system protein YbgF